MAACVSASLVHSVAAYVKPRDGKSAGFNLSFPGQCSQQEEGTSFLTSITRFSMNGFHSVSPLIQYKDTFESEKQWISCNSITDASAFATLVMSFAKRRVDKSSSLGMVCLVVGATLVLDGTKLIVIPTSFSIFKYTTAA